MSDLKRPKDMMYKSTRGSKELVTPSLAIVKGIAEDGGLYVPTFFPQIDFELGELVNMSYKEIAYRVLRLFLTDFTDEELMYCINGAYDSKFDTEKIVPVKDIKGDISFLELWHGKTLAFKDLALSILPYLMKVSAKKNGIEEKIVILTATSGDTGKAALEGFADVEGTSIIVFYPETGVSAVQKMQMVTQKGDNTCVVGIKGNFDDAQSAVKRIFTNEELKAELKKQGYIFSSANSINIGRLVPQVVYYFQAYAEMLRSGRVKLGDKFNVFVPTGNFGDILAGVYAKRAGLCIEKLVCASNDNKVLYDFFTSGEYDINREFKVTISPSMDILISSNLERYLYHCCDDTAKVKNAMQALSNGGSYTFDVGDEMGAEYATIDETLEGIAEVVKEENYYLDPHTAVGYVACKKYLKEHPSDLVSLVLSTASPFKFAKDVIGACEPGLKNMDPFEAVEKLGEKGLKIPEQIKDINKREILHKAVIERDEIESFVNGKLL